jgi:hypothetical protein
MEYDWPAIIPNLPVPATVPSTTLLVRHSAVQMATSSAVRDFCASPKSMRINSYWIIKTPNLVAIPKKQVLVCFVSI